jgi:DNA-binding transcriptional ArsR family regulator
MVNYSEAHLDRVFAALSDPTRRAVLSRLARTRPLSVSALAEPFDLKLHTVMKHLDVLADAGLIRRAKTGRTVQVEIAGGSLEPAVRWLERQERFWSASLDRLAVYAEAIEMAYWKAVLEAEIRWLSTFIDRITSRDIAWPLESRKER